MVYVSIWTYKIQRQDLEVILPTYCEPISQLKPNSDFEVTLGFNDELDALMYTAKGALLPPESLPWMNEYKATSDCRSEAL